MCLFMLYMSKLLCFPEKNKPPLTRPTTLKLINCLIYEEFPLKLFVTNSVEKREDQ